MQAKYLDYKYPVPPPKSRQFLCANPDRVRFHERHFDEPLLEHHQSLSETPPLAREPSTPTLSPAILLENTSMGARDITLCAGMTLRICKLDLTLAETSCLEAVERILQVRKECRDLFSNQ
ncbi:hypothetical protein BP6252_02264 [Coleophoma cylindrospora]|uniref:Uncharacterized protein n=1 Tax=Coleophoma cylindrospora TaxID=1849047 RepID=A0A3D8SEY7_9HELO|nr:hypothetical protein BP6252_02264 [Coleophoma cylindrospora]